MRFGFKSWSLCTPSGYLVNFEIYQGNNPRSMPQFEERFGKCAAPLINMIDDMPDHMRSLPFSFYFDNLFTSIPLLSYLKSRGYNATGTFRQNRIPSNCPITKKNIMKKKQRGTAEGFQLVDNSVVTVASTVHGVNPKSNATRYSREARKKIVVPRPCSVTEYNKYMCGVDRFDQNISLYRIKCRGKKWWSCIFTWLIDACLQNAWLLHRKVHQKMTQFEFRRQVAIYYCNHFGEASKSSGPRSAHRKAYDETSVRYTLRFDQVGHFPIASSRRRCAGELCKSSIRTACVKCDVGLCIPCFASYHTDK